jgi:tRNA threonylcarbamoyladenosine biosynthesis protein TsaE
MKIYQSFSSEETQKLGEAFARRTKKGKHAIVFALKGELGAGKTTFVRGFFKGLGLKGHAQSPTYIIMRRRPLRRKKFSNVFHMDAYRLKGAKHLTALGFKDVLADPGNIVLIEWADRVKRILPKGIAWLTFQHGKKGNQRTVVWAKNKRSRS